MVQVLFYLSVLATIGTLLLPVLSASRGPAVWSWGINFLAGGVITLVIKQHYPSWVEPQWHSGIVWRLIAWTLLTVGLIVAVRKPQKRDVPVT